MLPSVTAQGDYTYPSFIFIMAMTGCGFDLCLEFHHSFTYDFLLVDLGLNLAYSMVKKVV